jgi:hypothetical protein
MLRGVSVLRRAVPRGFLVIDDVPDADLASRAPLSAVHVAIGRRWGRARSHARIAHLAGAGGRPWPLDRIPGLARTRPRGLLVGRDDVLSAPPSRATGVVVDVTVRWRRRDARARAGVAHLAGADRGPCPFHGITGLARTRPSRLLVGRHDVLPEIASGATGVVVDVSLGRRGHNAIGRAGVLHVAGAGGRPWPLDGSAVRIRAGPHRLLVVHNVVLAGLSSGTCDRASLIPC